VQNGVKSLPLHPLSEAFGIFCFFGSKEHTNYDIRMSSQLRPIQGQALIAQSAAATKLYVAAALHCATQ